MEQYAEFMALSVSQNMRVTVGGSDMWVVPGDVIVDSPDGNRRLLHKIEFDQLVEHCGLITSEDRGFGWVVCHKDTH